IQGIDNNSTDDIWQFRNWTYIQVTHFLSVLFTKRKCIGITALSWYTVKREHLIYLPQRLNIKTFTRLLYLPTRYMHSDARARGVSCSSSIRCPSGATTSLPIIAWIRSRMCWLIPLESPIFLICSYQLILYRNKALSNWIKGSENALWPFKIS